MINTFADLKDKAELDLRRAVSVKAQDDILTKYKKDLDAVQTNIELLNATLDKIDKGGVTLDDLSDYVLSVSLHSIINPAIYAFDAANDIKEQLEIETKLDQIHKSLMTVALDGFVAQVKALPETQLISLKNEAAVIAARDTHKILTDSKYGFYTVDELAKLDNDTFHKAEKTLDLAEKHVDVLNQMNGKLDEDTKKPIEGNNALWINAQIKSYEKTNIGANPTTKLWLDKLVAMVEAWDNTSWTDATGKYDFELVTDKNDKENYSADIYNMIDNKIHEYILNIH